MEKSSLLTLLLHFLKKTVESDWLTDWFLFVDPKKVNKMKTLEQCTLENSYNSTISINQYDV